MKNAILPLLVLLLFASCQKEDNTSFSDQVFSEESLEATTRGPKPKVNVCHRRGENKWKVISISENALRAHLAHGDVLLEDKDEDGWVEAENECVPGGDCDDNNPNVNPGAKEDCTTAIDDNCDGVINEDCCPYFTVDQIVALGNNYRAFFNFREDDCLPIERIVFFGTPCPFGVSYDDIEFGYTYVKDPDCMIYEVVEVGILKACEDVMLRAQEILDADDFCDPLNGQIPGEASSVSLIKTKTKH